MILFSRAIQWEFYNSKVVWETPTRASILKLECIESAQFLICNGCLIQVGNDVNLLVHAAKVDLLLQEDERGYIQKAKQHATHHRAPRTGANPAILYSLSDADVLALISGGDGASFPGILVLRLSYCSYMYLLLLVVASSQVDNRGQAGGGGAGGVGRPVLRAFLSKFTLLVQVTNST